MTDELLDLEELFGEGFRDTRPQEAETDAPAEAPAPAPAEAPTPANTAAAYPLLVDSDTTPSNTTTSPVEASAPPTIQSEPQPEPEPEPEAQSPEDDESHEKIEDFLTGFGQRCVAFGYYCDQYMREEINLGEITRHMSEATGEGEAFFDQHHGIMKPEQLYRYQTMQKTLDDMATNLIETEIKRNRSVIQEAMSNGEYFIVNITFNSIHSSIYMVYNSPGERYKMERDHKLALLQEEQELTQALMKVLKVIDQKNTPESASSEDLQKLHKTLQIYVAYFKKVDYPDVKMASDKRVLRQMKDFVDHMAAHDYYDNRREIFRQISEFIATLKGGIHKELHEELDNLRERVRPPNPSEELDRLYKAALEAEGETNVYSAVIAFNNFAEKHRSLVKIHEYKNEIRKSIQRKGLS